MNNFYYVGFPRSGSHWIRLVLEDYTDGKSSLSNFLAVKNETVQKLYQRARKEEFKGTHDIDLKFKHENVIYLFRNPVDCIYSYLIYENLPLTEKEVLNAFKLWSDNINKWCFKETFTKNKTIICYKELQNNFEKEFSKILKSLNIPINKEKIKKSLIKFNKSKIKSVIHDKKVINLSNDYESNRLKFKEKFGKLIISQMTEEQINLWDDKSWIKSCE